MYARSSFASIAADRCFDQSHRHRHHSFRVPPKITRYAPHQPDFATAIANVVLELPGVVDSVEISSGEKRVLEWGGPEPGMRIKSRETWHDPA